jgi:phosphoribosyl-ATP pyrophosphohydrolase
VAADDPRAADAHILDELYAVIESRKGADPKTSRTAQLVHRGVAKIAQKVGEEAVETLIEGMRGDRDRLAEESADLLYHLLVLWADQNVRPEAVWQALAKRRETSAMVQGAPHLTARDAGEPRATIRTTSSILRADPDNSETARAGVQDIRPQAPVHVLIILKGAYV